MDLDELDLVIVFGFRFELIFATTPAASKNITCLKNGQK